MAFHGKGSLARWTVRVAVVSILVLGVPAGIVIARLMPHTAQHSADRGGPNTAKLKLNRHHGTGTVHHDTGGRTLHHHTGGRTLHASPGPAVAALDTALSKTVEAGNYDLTFTLAETGPGPNGGPGPHATGTGLATLDPQALSVNVTVGCLNGPVTVRVDGSDAWMIEGATSDPSGPPSSASSGSWAMSDLVDFQSSVNLCFARELGALATIGMASPEGQLSLSQQAIQGATPDGTVTVNGEQASEYAVEIDAAGFLEQPGSTVAENQAIQGALDVIGSNPIKATIAVDSAGYIVQMGLSVNYPDGVTASHTITLSNFGSAGSIQLPPVTPLPAPMSGLVGPAVCSNACLPSVPSSRAP